MTLTEIEDSVVESTLWHIHMTLASKQDVPLSTTEGYLHFLQATEIRRRLVDAAEKKASLKSYEISLAAPVTVPEEITFT